MIPSNATGTFTPKGGGTPVVTRVVVWDVGDDLRIRGEKPAFDHGVMFESALRYDSGNPIRENDTVAIVYDDGRSLLGTDGLGTPRGAALSRPRIKSGVISVSEAFFKESV